MADPNKRKVYVGDAVYAELNEFGQIVLTTEDGIAATNTIYLEPEVWTQLIEVVKMWRENAAAGGDHGRSK